MNVNRLIMNYEVNIVLVPHTLR